MGQKPSDPSNPARRQRWALGLTVLAALVALSWGLRLYVDSVRGARTPAPVAANPADPARSEFPAPRAQEATNAAPAVLPLPAAFATPSEPVPPAVQAKLIGKWKRVDAEYILSITAPPDGGGIEIAYGNPRPVHVGQAAVHQAAGKTALYVELRDRNYPGNNYELAYDAAKDQFAGVYHHLGVQQDFDVVFERMK